MLNTDTQNQTSTILSAARKIVQKPTKSIPFHTLKEAMSFLQRHGTQDDLDLSISALPKLEEKGKEEGQYMPKIKDSRIRWINN